MKKYDQRVTVTVTIPCIATTYLNAVAMFTCTSSRKHKSQAILTPTSGTCALGKQKCQNTRKKNIILKVNPILNFPTLRN